MKKVFNRLVSFVFVFVLAFTFLVGDTFLMKEQEVLASEELTYDENGFAIKDNILVRYNGKDSIVKIPNGVTAVGNDAFYECSNLKITLGKDVKYIGADAFNNCYAANFIVEKDSYAASYVKEHCANYTEK